MRRITRSFLWWLMALWVAGTFAQAADKRRNSQTKVTAAAEPADGKSFEAFQLITERNIFNANRVGRTKVTVEEKPPRIDEIALVGTMQYDRGSVAFFDSPDGVHRKVVREGETIADFKIERITEEGVSLLRGDQPLALKVNQQLRRAEGGEWTVNAAPPPKAEGPGAVASAAAPRGNDAAENPELSPDASEVLKRLMKKREKQFKQ